MIHIDTTHRTKVFFDDNHIKTIPKKYSDIFGEKHIINPRKKRLTKEERFELEVSLFEMDLHMNHPYAYKLIKRSAANFVIKVTTNRDQYYELVYKNNFSVKVPIDMYRLCLDKIEIKRNY